MRAMLLLVLAVICRPALAAEQLLEVTTPRGVTQPFYYQAPADMPVKANLIMFEGGPGRMNPRNPGFLESTHSTYVPQGYAVALLAPPSDLAGPGMTVQFRASVSHREDIETVMAWMEAKNPAPTWLVGVSLGTISAAFIASTTTRPIGGVALFSSKTQGKVGVMDFPLNHITAPALVIANKRDTCHDTPWTDAAGIERALRNSPRHKTLLFDGGSPQQRRDPCIPGSFHTFTGLEGEVVRQVADFLDAK